MYIAPVRLLGLVLWTAWNTVASAAPQTAEDTVVVTGAKLPTALATLPSMMSVVTGAELRARGARDLRSALALVAGVEISPGGDAGPASSVPALWGLREFDAFLLVVDGIPYGGAFNPALATLDLTNVERIEVLRGAAPVGYGATSFVGVIHVIHAQPGHGAERASISAGTHGSKRFALSGDLPGTSSVQHSLTVNGEDQGFVQRDAEVGKLHVLYRAALSTEVSHWHVDLDAMRLRQDPYSPHPREGATLSTRFVRDANVNPRDARQDSDRVQLNSGYARALGATQLALTFSAADTDSAATRGFLRENFAVDGTTPNADGFRQRQHTTDVWLDLAWSGSFGAQLRWALGTDWLYGKGHQRSGNFEYAVLANGGGRPLSTALPVDEATRLSVERNFFGLYAQAEWQLTTRWKWLGGLRLNHTEETRAGEFSSASLREGDHDSHDETRPTGSIGSSYVLFEHGLTQVTAFADWRASFKPAAADLGPEAESDILRPESAASFEVGLRGRMFDARMQWEASGFDMDFRNLVIRENLGGLPALANAGRERLRGGELEIKWAVTSSLSLSGAAAYHDSWFADYARLRPDGSIEQLRGKALELAPQAVGALGVILAPAQGVIGSLVANYAGGRYLNKSNTARAGGYAVLDAGLGYRYRRYELRLDATNLSDRRDPVAESEIGDAQFYRLPGRTVMATLEFSL